MTAKLTDGRQRDLSYRANSDLTANVRSASLPSRSGGRFAERRLVGELMDEPDLDADLHRAALNGLARANAVSFSPSVLARAVLELVRGRNRASVRILDVACGSGDVTLKVVQQLEHHGIQVEAIGCDISQVAISHADERRSKSAVADSSRIEFRQLDVLSDNLPDCEVVVSSLFLHHLTQPDALQLMQRMGACSEHLLIHDLCRTHLGYWMAWAVCRLLTRSHIVHVDGPRSVEAAFTPQEALALAQEAGLVGASVRRTWPERFLLQWSRPD